MPRAPSAPGASSKERARSPRILVLHGPNLNLLGEREPHIYGTTTLADIDRALHAKARERRVQLETFQSNHEGMLIDRVQAARHDTNALIINAGGYTHTSVALRDAVASTGLPTIEVHLSNLAKREDFRHESYLTAVSVGLIAGFGADSYYLALEAACNLIETSGVGSDTLQTKRVTKTRA